MPLRTIFGAMVLGLLAATLVLCQPPLTAHADGAARGAIFGSFNVNTDWNVSGPPIDGVHTGTNTPCVGAGADRGVTKGTVMEIRTSRTARSFTSAKLGPGLTNSLPSSLFMTGKVVSQGSSSEVCQFDVDVSGLPEAQTYYVTLSRPAGPPLGPFRVSRYRGGSQPPFEVTLDPSTIGSTPPPGTATTASGGSTVVKVSGSGHRLQSITVLDGSNQVRETDVRLPYARTLPDNPSHVGLEAQTSDGSAGATVTCEIDMPNRPPVTQTSNGPYALVDCTAGSP